MKTLREIQTEQHDWSLRNFGPHGPDDPLDGLIEEFGELHHAVLKRRQGIRGTAEEHDAAERDALGDMCIYLLDLLSTMSAIPPEFVEMISLPGSTPERMRRDMLLQIADVATVVPLHGTCDLVGDRYAIEDTADELLAIMATYAEARGWSLLQIVNETWEQVSKRDWTKERGEGGLGSTGR